MSIYIGPVGLKGNEILAGPSQAEKMPTSARHLPMHTGQQVPAGMVGLGQSAGSHTGSSQTTNPSFERDKKKQSRKSHYKVTFHQPQRTRVH